MPSQQMLKLLISSLWIFFMINATADAGENQVDYTLKTPYPAIVTVPAACLAISAGDSYIKIYFDDGNAVIPQGMDFPEAAKRFWEAVGKAYPAFRESILAQERLKGEK